MTRRTAARAELQDATRRQDKSEDEKIFDDKGQRMPDETGKLEAVLDSIDGEQEMKNVEACLDQFEEDLKEANLTDKTIRRHVSNAALYLDWLTQHEGCPVAEAPFAVEGFFGRLVHTALHVVYAREHQDHCRQLEKTAEQHAGSRPDLCG